jgi:nitrous oxidase accessory protein
MGRLQKQLKPLIATIFVTFVLLGQIGTLEARTITVETQGAITSIKVAIVRAQAGDTILVKAGTYKEGLITIDKPLVLMGENYPIIDGESKGEIIHIKSDDVVIEGFSIINSGTSSFEDLAAVRIITSKHVTIRNNKLTDTFFGILSQFSTHSTIEGNILQRSPNSKRKSANGIHCWKSSDLTIKDNIVTGHRDGIYLEFVTNSVIHNNQSVNNSRYGLHFMFAHDNEYEDNIIKKNGAGVAVMYSKRVKMKNNMFSDNWGNAAYAILLKDLNDSEIIGNHFERNTVAILAEGSTRITMKDNHFENNGWALKVMGSCDNVEVTNNNFISNTFDIATNSSITENTFNSNYWDKYEGYDLDRNGVGDVPFRPVSLYSMLIERNSAILMLFRSFFVNLMDRAERVLPGLTPQGLIDEEPKMRMIN